MNKFNQYLLTIYGNKLNLHRGKIHDYQGKDLDYSGTGFLKVSKKKYIQNFLDGFTEELRGTSATPVEDHMLQLRGEDEAEFLEEYWADMFHQSVAQFLFMI